jgi:hypothetical protein
MLLATACASGEAAAPRVSVSRPPSTLRAGEEWLASVQSRVGRPHSVVIRRGSRVKRFRLVRSGRRYRASVVFPAAGRWRYGVRVGRSDRLVDTATIRRAVTVLQQPFGIVWEPDGALLVADFRANAIFRLDPAGGEGEVVARIPAPRDFREAPGGRLLISSGTRVLELERATWRVRTVVTAAGALEGVAADMADPVYAVEGQRRVVRLGSDGSRTVLVDGLDGAHGILASSLGLVICESFAGNVKVLEPDGTVRVLAHGLGNPSFAVEGRDGLYVTEFSANRVSLVTPTGAVRPVASVTSPGPIALDGEGRLLVGGLDGRITRVDPSTGRTSRVWPR